MLIIKVKFDEMSIMYIYIYSMVLALGNVGVGLNYFS